MKDKLIPIFCFCVAFFVILYAGFVYKSTYDISLVNYCSSGCLPGTCTAPCMELYQN